MAAVDSPRSPPALGPAFKQGSLRLDFDLRPTTTVNILETYSPFPSFGNTRDPFNLDTFLLHPSEVPWEFLNNSPFPGEALLVTGKEKPTKSDAPNSRVSMLRRPSPLASNPPLSAKVEDDNDEEDVEEPSEATTPGPSPPRRPRSAAAVGGKALRALMSGNRKSSNPLLTPDSDTPDTVPTTPEEPPFETPQLQPPDRRSMYSLSGSSSEDSCDGIQTPTHSNSSPTDVTARLAAALQEDQQRLEDQQQQQQQQRKNNRASWRDWLGGRRTSFLGHRGESGSTLLESPRASVVDLIPEEDSIMAPAIPDSDLARSAQQLRRLSLIKLGSLRLPSPHPLAPVLERQSANLPNEVAFAIPTSRRVYPQSVNVVSRSDPLPAQPGLRVALGLRDIIQRIDAGERPTELLNVQRRTPPRATRARGVRDFVSRQPFEERNVVYYPDDWVEEVSMARPGYGVWDLEFSDYILAMAETEERPPRNYSLRPKSPQTPQSRSSLSAAPVVKVTKAEGARQALKPLLEAPVLAVATMRSAPPGPAAATSMPPPPLSISKARPRPSTWDDSSDDEGLSDSAVTKAQAPVRPPTMRNQTAPAAVTGTARIRQSRVIDAGTALEMVTASRDRRHEANMNHVQRKAVTDQRRVSTMIVEEQEKRRTQYAKSVHEMRRPQPSKRVSSMTLSADAHAATLNRRASSQTLAATAQAQAQTRKSIAPLNSKQRSPPGTPSKSRPAASLPSSPRLQAGDRRPPWLPCTRASLLWHRCTPA
ncbi:hypothetical protein CC85DRAFT_293921 [Cutaneotrichosporon oleaginosum]|uniref:Uncharacterized protein n=1 Tax=Cutaneotrichosporon oleaginosum TaxID=879819 RepID=A0A0J0XDX1_9TREE|nr:uncharacterized protein CC85DRAFT_293921 [Cutaneotrichosporon oleaginosum]KLT39286.1 hypothetical protein CC85DRAFT_293921 [Cutaneotrichosporon oleaginosum]TXT05882.1 hypothetical protein COLE_07202 [Cutaneotrichosporon oleaginosum]